MPLYEFVCEKCNNEMTQLCDTNVDKIKCEKCNNDSYKILSKSNWIFKTSCSNPLAPKENKKETKKEKKYESRILLDFGCPNCGINDELYIYPSESDKQLCEKCNCKLELKGSCTNYELKYDPKKDLCDWQGNTSQYWTKVKDERKSGKNVKGINEK